MNIPIKSRRILAGCRSQWMMTVEWRKCITRTMPVRICAIWLSLQSRWTSVYLRIVSNCSIHDKSHHNFVDLNRQHRESVRENESSTDDSTFPEWLPRVESLNAAWCETHLTARKDFFQSCHNETVEYILQLKSTMLKIRFVFGRSNESFNVTFKRSIEVINSESDLSLFVIVKIGRKFSRQMRGVVFDYRNFLMNLLFFWGLSDISP